MLEAVESAGDTFSMVELGAGYGRWSVRGFLAARQRGINRIRIIAVEAEPQHAAWLRRCLEINGMTGPLISVEEAAVSVCAGESYFAVKQPQNIEPFQAREWYGQFMFPRHALGQETGECYNGHPAYALANEWTAVRVPTITLSHLLSGESVVDIVDMDIQSEEAAVVASSIADLTEKVKRLHIGTHSPEIEVTLTEVLTRAGWICLRSYPCNSVTQTPFGMVVFQDGLQSWINPSLR